MPMMVSIKCSVTGPVDTIVRTAGGEEVVAVVDTAGEVGSVRVVDVAAGEVVLVVPVVDDVMRNLKENGVFCMISKNRSTP